jgi:hypothetical protein
MHAATETDADFSKILSAPRWSGGELERRALAGSTEWESELVPKAYTHKARRLNRNWQA